MTGTSIRVPDAWLGREVVQIVGNSAYGGGAAVIFRIMHICRDIGLRPVLLATHPDVVAAARNEGFEIWEFPGILREPRPLSDLAASVRLAAALRRRGTSIVHTHTSKGGMVGRLGAWLVGVPVIIHHTHGFYHTGMAPGIARTVMESLERVFARMDDIQVFLGEDEAAASIEQRIVPAEKMRVVPNGIAAAPAVSHDQCETVRASWGVPPNAPLIGTVARLSNQQKGLDAGMSAVAGVLASCPDTHWVILGEGEDRESLAETAIALGISDRVRMPGHMSDVRRAYACFDVVFAPSRREGQSITILEAMAAGRPIVSTDIPGNAGLLEHGQNALLTKPDDTVAMAAALTRVLEDRSLGDALGHAAQARFEERFTLERFDAEIARMYVEALAHARPRR